MHCSKNRLFDHVVGTAQQRDRESDAQRTWPVAIQVEFCGAKRLPICPSSRSGPPEDSCYLPVPGGCWGGRPLKLRVG